VARETGLVGEEPVAELRVVTMRVEHCVGELRLVPLGIGDAAWRSSHR
jgi:hypothetical protein